MRRKKTLLLSQVLKEYRSQMNIDTRPKEVSRVNSWE